MLNPLFGFAKSGKILQLQNLAYLVEMAPFHQEAGLFLLALAGHWLEKFLGN